MFFFFFAFPELICKELVPLFFLEFLRSLEITLLAYLALFKFPVLPSVHLCRQGDINIVRSFRGRIGDPVEEAHTSTRTHAATRAHKHTKSN